jgi:hypothetical protein
MNLKLGVLISFLTVLQTQGMLHEYDMQVLNSYEVKHSSACSTLHGTLIGQEKIIVQEYKKLRSTRNSRSGECYYRGSIGKKRLNPHDAAHWALRLKRAKRNDFIVSVFVAVHNKLKNILLSA